MTGRKEYAPPALERSVSYATGADRSRELGDFAERFELHDLGGFLGRAECRTCGASFHVVHSPLTRSGVLELAEHIVSHGEPPA